VTDADIAIAKTPNARLFIAKAPDEGVFRHNFGVTIAARSTAAKWVVNAGAALRRMDAARCERGSASVRRSALGSHLPNITKIY
jgi:hypothetical protein